ncbi:hypothetical protein FRC06_004739 [Ceratobasidium sp. 370]|nr:hypothetical protein FRC06_004739 [Ceratobasidium sp. 370]
MSLSGILAVLIVKGSFNAPLFLEFIELCLAAMNPFPGPNSVLVLDNCSIHVGDEVRAMADARGVVLMYLPSYSPDYNPIELAFSKMKASFRREGQAAAAIMNQNDDEAEADARALLFRHVYWVTPENAEQYFRHCGYI